MWRGSAGTSVCRPPSSGLPDLQFVQVLEGRRKQTRIAITMAPTDPPPQPSRLGGAARAQPSPVFTGVSSCLGFPTVWPRVPSAKCQKGVGVPRPHPTRERLLSFTRAESCPLQKGVTGSTFSSRAKEEPGPFHLYLGLAVKASLWLSAFSCVLWMLTAQQMCKDHRCLVGGGAQVSLSPRWFQPLSWGCSLQPL